MKTLIIKEHALVSIQEIPVFEYRDFFNLAMDLLQMNGNDCRNYYGVIWNNKLKIICRIADKVTHTAHLLAYEIPYDDSVSKYALVPLSRFIPALYKYEQEITRIYGLKFNNVISEFKNLN